MIRTDALGYSGCFQQFQGCLGTGSGQHLAEVPLQVQVSKACTHPVQHSGESTGCSCTKGLQLLHGGSGPSSRNSWGIQARTD